MSEQTPKKVVRQGRSPSYPGIDLEAALEKAQELYTKEMHHHTTPQTVTKHWGYSGASGPGTIALAALKKFGLLDEEGRGSDRKVWLSQLALQIIKDKRESSADRSKALWESGLTPAIHKEIWEQYGNDRPSDETLLYHLEMDKKFTERGAKEFISQYKKTLNYLNLNSSATIETEDQGNNEEPAPFGRPEGSLIAPSDQMSQVPVNPGVKMNQMNLPLDEGQVVLQWPASMSKTSLEDFQDWLDLVLRKAKRSVVEETKPEESNTDPLDQ